MEICDMINSSEEGCVCIICLHQEQTSPLRVSCLWLLKILWFQAQGWRQSCEEKDRGKQELQGGYVGAHGESVSPLYLPLDPLHVFISGFIKALYAVSDRFWQRNLHQEELIALQYPISLYVNLQSLIWFLLVVWAVLANQVSAGVLEFWDQGQNFVRVLEQNSSRSSGIEETQFFSAL